MHSSTTANHIQHNAISLACLFNTLNLMTLPDGLVSRARCPRYNSYTPQGLVWRGRCPRYNSYTPLGLICRGRCPCYNSYTPSGVELPWLVSPPATYLYAKPPRREGTIILNEISTHSSPHRKMRPRFLSHISHLTSHISLKHNRPISVQHYPVF